MGVATRAQPDYTSQSGNTYKGNIDASLSVDGKLAGQFAPHEENSPAMTVRLDAGRLWDVDGQSLTEVAAQSSGTITAPTTNPRKDIVYIDQTSGVVGVATGTEAVSPSDPAVPTGKIPVARVTLATSTTAITNPLIDDLRQLYLPPVSTSSEDQVARDLALTAYIKADIAAADPAGVYGDIMSDNFTSDTLATATNATYDAAGDYYHNGGSVDTSGSNIGNMTGAGGVAAAFDVNTNQSTAAGAQITAVSGWLGKNWGTSKQIAEALVWRPNNAGFDGVGGGGTITVTVEGSATGAWGGEEVSLGSSTATDYDSTRGGAGQSSDDAPSSYDYIKVAVTSTAYAYHRAVITGAGSEVRVAEVQFVSGVQDITLRPSANPLPIADPLDLSIYFRVRDIDVVTEGTDRVVKVSIDGGTTWATATITSLGDYGSTDKLIRADADVSAQSGSSFVWEVTTANNKEQQIKQVASVAGY